MAGWALCVKVTPWEISKWQADLVGVLHDGRISGAAGIPMRITRFRSHEISIQESAQLISTLPDRSNRLRKTFFAVEWPNRYETVPSIKMH